MRKVSRFCVKLVKNSCQCYRYNTDFMGFIQGSAAIYLRQGKRPKMILGDALILTPTQCDKRHFVYDERISEANIIAILHDEGNGIVVDIAPRA